MCQSPPASRTRLTDPLPDIDLGYCYSRARRLRHDLALWIDDATVTVVVTWAFGCSRKIC
jgi:hypothetical protein